MLFCCLAFAVIISNALAALAPCVPCGQKFSKIKLEKILDAKARRSQGFRRASGDVEAPLAVPASEAPPGAPGSEAPSAPAGPTKRARRCCPYDFDSKLCQVINDRLLCGYNKNVGKPESDETPISLSGGCRLRGGRLECGYEQAPFNGIRRPPAWNGAANNEVPPSDVGQDDAQYDEDYFNNENKQRLNIKKLSRSRKPRLKAATKCVEVRDRIVCKALD